MQRAGADVQHRLRRRSGVRRDRRSRGDGRDDSAPRHTEFRVQPSAIDLLDTLVYHHDGPFADSSAIPTYLVSKLTRAARHRGADRRWRRRGVCRLPALWRGARGRARARRGPAARPSAALDGPAVSAERAPSGRPGRSASRATCSCRCKSRLTAWAGVFYDDLESLLTPDFSARVGAIDRARHLQALAGSRRTHRRSASCWRPTFTATCTTICW